MAGLFEVNESGTVSYAAVVPDLTETPEVTLTPEVLKTPEVTQTPEVTEIESEVSQDVGSNVVEGNDEGSLLPSSQVLPEVTVEVEENTSEVVIPLTDDGFVPVVLSEEITAAILGDTAASGSLASSTLEYFDRIVSGLPQDYKYIAYRNNNDDSYDGVLYFGRHFEVDGNNITFGNDSVEIIVDRVSTGNYSNYVTNYYSSAADGVSVDFNQNGAVVFYTNIVEGYPVLGGYTNNISIIPFILSALICAFVSVIFNKLMKGR